MVIHTSTLWDSPMLFLLTKCFIDKTANFWDCTVEYKKRDEIEQGKHK